MTIQITRAQSLSAQRQKKGFTLTEIAIVLGIMGLILGAIWTAAASVYNNQKITHANTAIVQMAQGIRNLYAQSATTGVVANTNMNAALISAGVVPTDMVTGAAAMNDPWPGGTTAVISTSSAAADGFTIQMTNVPISACIALLSTVGGMSRDQGLSAVGATTAAAPVVASVAGVGLPTGNPQIAVITPAIATQACTANNNIVQFGFQIKS